jgi:uncharacterized membrane protein
MNRQLKGHVVTVLSIAALVVMVWIGALFVIDHVLVPAVARGIGYVPPELLESR